MTRSFTDRLFGGVCGGLGAVMHISPWWFRAAFLVLGVVTSGTFIALYILLWWIIPQESLVDKRRARPERLLMVILLIIATLIGWLAAASGSFRTESGQDLFWPIIFLILAIVFFLKQVRS
jgi:phage shock protein PspC (stress-responsive transcriptional regulator)